MWGRGLERWDHPGKDFISSGVFISLAESYGLIDALMRHKKVLVFQQIVWSFP